MTSCFTFHFLKTICCYTSKPSRCTTIRCVTLLGVLYPCACNSILSLSLIVEGRPTKDTAQSSRLSVPDIPGTISYVLGFHNVPRGLGCVLSVRPPTPPSLPCLSEEERSKLLEMSPVFQMLKELQLQLEGGAHGGTAILRGSTSATCTTTILLNIFWALGSESQAPLCFVQVKAADS